MSRTLAKIVSEYRTVSRIVNLPAGVWTRLLLPDARRWNVQLGFSDSAVDGLISPGDTDGSEAVGLYVLAGTILEWKFQDKPAQTCGAFWAQSFAPGFISVIEEIWIRD